MKLPEADTSANEEVNNGGNVYVPRNVIPGGSNIVIPRNVLQRGGSGNQNIGRQNAMDQAMLARERNALIRDQMRENNYNVENDNRLTFDDDDLENCYVARWQLTRVEIHPVTNRRREFWSRRQVPLNLVQPKPETQAER